MTTKKTDAGREYDIDGKTFTWHPLDDDDQPGNLEAVRIPLRLKLKVIRSMADRDLDAGAMFAILEALIPNQAEALDEMDVNDFQAMFEAWQGEYNALSGASLGEPSRSAS